MKPPLILDSPAIRVLALDTSTHCGWAHDTIPGKPPAYGTWELGSWKPETVERAFGLLYGHVERCISEHAISHVVIEKPLGVYAHTGFKSKTDWSGKARKDQDLAAALIGFWAAAGAATWNAGAQYIETAPSTVRAHFIGNGRHPDPKAAVMARCRQLGHRPQNDNEGDAIAIWDCAKSTLDPGWNYRTTPLFETERGRG